MDVPSEEDHYSNLKINVDATVKTIKSAARKLYLIHHPDKRGDPAEFRKVREAEEVLTDANARYNYDCRYPRIQAEWAAYHATETQRQAEKQADLKRQAEEKRREREQEVLRKAQEARERAAKEKLEKARREEDVLRKAREERERAAKERLEKARREEERIRKAEEERLKVEEERRKDIEEQERREALRRAKEREAQMARVALARSEMAAEKRRQEMKKEAELRIVQQRVDVVMQEQRQMWSAFYNKQILGNGADQATDSAEARVYTDVDVDGDCNKKTHAKTSFKPKKQKYRKFAGKYNML